MYIGIDSLKENSPKYYAYITGSDQVWNKNITNGLDDIYTLNFGDKKTKRISYAASIGMEVIDKDNTKELANKLKVIDNISVREETAKEQLSSLKNKKVEVVFDPTLMLDSKEWDKYSKNNSEKDYILSYVVEKSKEHTKILKKLAKDTGCKIITFDKYSIHKNAYTADPFEFIGIIKNAKYIVTTSFHATIFSIIYKKDFFVVPHKKTGSRVRDLLAKLKLSSRIIDSFEDFKNINYNSETNYEESEKILEEERKKSKKFLIDALKKE